MLRTLRLLAAASIAGGTHAAALQQAASTRFEISFPASVRSEPTTGRVFVTITRDSTSEPRLQSGSWYRNAPLFAVDVDRLAPGKPAVIDGGTPGYPVKSLREIPAGDYWVQGLLNLYTQFQRSDGHVIWAHMDQWEGQHLALSPGNPISEPTKVHLDPRTGYSVKLTLSKVIPPVVVPEDTKWVKWIKMRSDLLSKFWGRPIYLGAIVLLPKDYDAHPDVSYPVVYLQGHFHLIPPFDFSTEDTPETEAQRAARGANGLETGYQFYQAWNSDNFPRVIAVAWLHPTPYFDDSYAVNSANNGPYGDALMQELVPYLEQHFRMIRKPYARVLTGGSTGGWESLALQVYHPDFFGGTWTFYPDPVDFRRYGLSDIYSDPNAFTVPGYQWLVPERYFWRSPDGQPLGTMRQLSQLESVLGSHGRSGLQLDIWQAVYGPVGADGYPRDIWNQQTGEIDRSVAQYMRDHGYDLRAYLEQHWAEIGPELVAKIRIYCGDMDDYFLNESVYLMEQFLESTRNPYYGGLVEYGRPEKGHGWHPMTNAQLIRMMADHITVSAPPGENPGSWKY